eukprot:5807014-Amphidinium_carterae.1
MKRSQTTSTPARQSVTKTDRCVFASRAQEPPTTNIMPAYWDCRHVLCERCVPLFQTNGWMLVSLSPDSSFRSPSRLRHAFETHSVHDPA